MKKIQKYLFLSSLAATAVGVVLQFILLAKNYEPEMRLYVRTPLLYVFYGVIALAAGICLALYFTGDKTPDASYGADNVFTRVAAVFCAVIAAGVTALRLTAGLPGKGVSAYISFASKGALICSVLLVAYFISVCFPKRNNALTALFGIGGMAWCIFEIMQIYFDMTYPIASPARSFGMFTLMFMLLYLTSEVRYLLGEGKRRGYLASASLFIFFAVSCSVPMLLCDGFALWETALMLLEGVFAMYALLRVISLIDKPVEEKTMKYVIKSYPELSKVDWNTVPRANIDKWGWGYEYKPECYAQAILAEDKGLVVRLTAMEKEPRAVRTEFMSDVCCDSCMEFFFSPDRVSYANFEFNALGTMHASCGAPGSRQSIDKLTEMPIVRPIVKDDRWQIVLVLTPENFKDLTGLELAGGTKFYGNFYKCGDECEQIHYGMWSEVKTEKPSFHQPDYFGEIIIAE